MATNSRGCAGGSTGTVKGLWQRGMAVWVMVAWVYVMRTKQGVAGIQGWMGAMSHTRPSTA
eukprot:40065-Eustigmatos_ZCMA.PRE.1